MSFLDNLENNLKTLESSDENLRSDARRREADQKRAKAAGPWAERLKNGEFAKKLMREATRSGFELRTKVHMTWIGAMLRLEARDQRLELHPSPDGVAAVIYAGGSEIARKEVSPDGDPTGLLRDWMALVAQRKRLDDEAAAAALNQLED